LILFAVSCRTITYLGNAPFRKICTERPWLFEKCICATSFCLTFCWRSLNNMFKAKRPESLEHCLKARVADILQKEGRRTVELCKRQRVQVINFTLFGANLQIQLDKEHHYGSKTKICQLKHSSYLHHAKSQLVCKKLIMRNFQAQSMLSINATSACSLKGKWVVLTPIQTTVLRWSEEETVRMSKGTQSCLFRRKLICLS